MSASKLEKDVSLNFSPSVGNFLHPYGVAAPISPTLELSEKSHSMVTLSSDLFTLPLTLLPSSRLVKDSLMSLLYIPSKVT
ncbi:hypothetical protein L2E82_51970 [Cichorium intybus]|nr:hypothetical protein L2E82_51970 [Cichorium intybus]